MKEHLSTVVTVLIAGFFAVAGLTGCAGEAQEQTGSETQMQQQEHGHSHGEDGHSHSQENGHQH